MVSDKGSRGLVFTVDETVVASPSSEPNEKGVMNVESRSATDESEPPKDFPLKWKLIALASGIALSWGSSFSENTLGPLKDTLKTKLKITNAQYGAIDSATSLVNTILPIIGGFWLDYYGVEWGSLTCSIFILLGAIISAAGTNNASFGLILGGRVVMGFGSTVIETCTSKILAHWFQHRGLGLVYGLDVAVGKLIVLAAKAAAVPMRDASSFWGWALWIPALVCFANLLQNIHYFWWARSRPKWAQIPTGQLVRKQAKESQPLGVTGDHALSTGDRTSYQPSVFLNWKTLNHVPRFFWLMVCSQILQAGVVGSFNSLNADIIRLTRGSTDEIAGYTSAVQQVIPVVCSPFVGAFFDFFGHRMMIVSVTSALWILVYTLIGLSHVNALGVMIVASVASTMNALPFLASIPLVVPEQIQLGLVFGFWKAFNNSGRVIVDMIAGRLQDITPGETYERVIIFFVCCKGLEFCLGLFYGLLDKRYLGGILAMSEKKRFGLELDGKLADLVGHKPKVTYTMTGCLLLCSLVVTAWVVFILYSL